MLLGLGSKKAACSQEVKILELFAVLFSSFSFMSFLSVLMLRFFYSNALGNVHLLPAAEDR